MMHIKKRLSKIISTKIFITLAQLIKMNAFLSLLLNLIYKLLPKSNMIIILIYSINSFNIK